MGERQPLRVTRRTVLKWGHWRRLPQHWAGFQPTRSPPATVSSWSGTKRRCKASGIEAGPAKWSPAHSPSSTPPSLTPGPPTIIARSGPDWAALSADRLASGR